MENIEIVSGRAVTHRMIAEAIELDRVSYDDAYQLQVDACVKYFKKNPEIYIMALDKASRRVVGYINFSPIRPQMFRQLLSGSVIDTVITGEDLVPYELSGDYWGYFSSIVVHPVYRRHLIATQMLLRWAGLVTRLAAERKIFFRGIVADAVGRVGEHLLSKIGFSLVRPSAHDSTIMAVDFFREGIERTEFNRSILEIYEKRRKGDGLSDEI